MAIDFDNIIVGLGRIKDRKEEELLKLLEQPDLFSVAQELVDALDCDLLYLFNYSHLVDGHGEKRPIQELYDRLRQDMVATFLCLTGKEYKPQVVRQMERLKDERLLDAIMRPDEEEGNEHDSGRIGNERSDFRAHPAGGQVPTPVHQGTPRPGRRPRPVQAGGTGSRNVHGIHREVGEVYLRKFRV